MEEFTIVQMLLAEFFGTLLMILLGLGTSASVKLRRSPARNSGWVYITFGWGFAVMAGTMIAGSISGGHLNPAVSFAFMLRGELNALLFVCYSIVQILGAFFGAHLMYQLYYDYFKENHDGDLVSVFATAPTIENPARNYLSSIIGSFIIIMFILSTSRYEGLSPIFVPLVIIGVGMSLGNLVGYAFNPARDLGPRLMYHFHFRHPKKGCANLKYQHVPFFGPFIGSALAVVMFAIMH